MPRHRTAQPSAAQRTAWLSTTWHRHGNGDAGWQASLLAGRASLTRRRAKAPHLNCSTSMPSVEPGLEGFGRIQWAAVNSLIARARVTHANLQSRGACMGCVCMEVHPHAPSDAPSCLHPSPSCTHGLDQYPARRREGERDGHAACLRRIVEHTRVWPAALTPDPPRWDVALVQHKACIVAMLLITPGVG